MAATADDDDYEVIYENSPLYWSMVDAGLDRVGGEDVHKNIETSPMCTELHTTACNKQSWRTGISRWFSHVAAPFVLKYPINTELRDMNQKVFKVLAGSSLLTEEDALFLEDLMAGQRLPVKQAPSSLTRRKLALSMMVIICLLISSLSLWPSPAPWITIAFNTLLVLFIPALLVQVLAAWKSESARRKCEVFQGGIQDFLTVANKSMDVAAKCVRFIQESELVARGFTFVGSRVTSRVLNELQMTSRQRQCPALREKLFLTSRTLFFTFRHSFSQLVSVCPVNVEVSGVMRYCSEIPLSHYPQILQLEPADQDTLANLHDMTDGFSIDILKSMQELNRIHISEFIRRLAVCFVQDIADMDLPLSLTPILDTMRDGLETALKDLQSHLAAYRHGPLSASMRTKKPTSWQPVSSADQLRQTYTAVHSLELHLLAALKKIQDISLTMEKKIEEGSKEGMGDDCNEPTSKDGIEDSCRETWNQMLLMVKSELNACAGCLEEGVKLLEKKDTTEPLLPGTQAQQPSPANSVDVKVVKMSAQDNPIILDEVFEAYSEPQEHGGGRGHSEFTLDEEEAWRRKQKRDLKLCLNELQSIIDVRAAERQEREQIALARMKSAAPEIDHHLPMIGASEGQNEHVGAPVNSIHSKEEELEDDIVVRSCDKEPEESVDDRAKDIEDRVEFWKQFNQRELYATVSKEENDVRYNDDDGNDTERSISSIEARDLEIRNAPCYITASDSQKSSFVSCNIHGSENGQSDSVLTQSAPDNEVEEADIQRLSGATQNTHTPIGGQTKDTDLQKLSTNSSTDGSFFMSNTNSDDEAPAAGERREPEGIVEHLSLAAAPSPFAFSVASMVASRARNFAQTEDTFGDSSSDEGEDGKEDQESVS